MGSIKPGIGNLGLFVEHAAEKVAGTLGEVGGRRRYAPIQQVLRLSIFWVLPGRDTGNARASTKVSRWFLVEMQCPKV